MGSANNKYYIKIYVYTGIIELGSSNIGTEMEEKPWSWGVSDWRWGNRALMLTASLPPQPLAYLKPAALSDLG